MTAKSLTLVSFSLCENPLLFLLLFAKDMKKGRIQKNEKTCILLSLYLTYFIVCSIADVFVRLKARNTYDIDFIQTGFEVKNFMCISISLVFITAI